MFPKEFAKKTGRLYLVDDSEIESVREYCEMLEQLLTGPFSIWEEDGELQVLEIKQLVEKVGGLKIEIYSNEHPPPHFHVKSANINASFAIEDCLKLNGKVDTSDYKKIKYWHKRAKPKLIEAWNNTRPTNCVVGAYAGT
ncbi:hypothetical protein AN395_00353 [Pseudoalteromonas sp. P1-30]|uniref:DUF4160 domain-containing protein n=1 Tax=Pseudoalteromonas sp. P1-30 TaxID=1723760 RepID=UPI0006D63A37|nr:DUF4160 domain-containing protein [Pseudoalteromonas sp. P1-30]KPV93227.1 hypothetical protein AN395_00353 [Pseudoalteromonas sp. P1-30]